MPIATSLSNARPRAILEDLQNRFGALLLAAKTARARRRRYVSTLSELCALSDRELADLGIPRAHIRRLAIEESYMEHADEK
jgi:uncharacterized protein YjiS (DUF1127 family)